MIKIGADDFGQASRKSAEIITDLILDEAKSFKPRWLDHGSGDGPCRKNLIFNFGQCIVTDIDLDVQELPFEDSYFNTITSTEIIEHLYNPLFALLELKRVLSDNGDLYLTTPNDYSIVYKAEHVLSRKYRPHFHQFNERDLYDLFGRAMFKIVNIKKFFRSKSGTIARISRNGLFVHAKKI